MTTAWDQLLGSALMIERKLPRVEQGPEKVLGGLAQGCRLLQLGSPAREFLGAGRTAYRPQIEVLDQLVGFELELQGACQVAVQVCDLGFDGVAADHEQGLLETQRRG